jgi:uncharacterized membrane protein YphA (DoxX/SURF4 family)
MISVRRALLVMLICATAGVAYLVVAATPILSLFARGTLAGLFLLAGATKLRDRRSFSSLISGLGVPTPLAPSIAVVVPVAELGAAVALVVPATATAGAVGAVALLLVFLAVTAVAIARGGTPDCGCFGPHRSAQFTTRTLLRNSVLLGMAGGLVADSLRQPAAFASLGVAAFVAIGLHFSRRTAIETIAEPTQEPFLTRRSLVRGAGTAGLAGAAGAWLGLLDASPANAASGSTQVHHDVECGGCTCCGWRKVNGGAWYCDKYCCASCTGFSGGGTIQTPSGQAQASFFGNTTNRGRGAQLFSGALSWFDPTWQGTGLSLQSTEIASYGKVHGIRQLVGFATANGTGRHKFVLQAIDTGQPGSGKDTVTLSVSGLGAGGAGGTGSEYQATGNLVQGDITTSLQTTVRSRSGRGLFKGKGPGSG